MRRALAATWPLFARRLVRPARLAVPVLAAIVVVALGAVAGASDRAPGPLAARLLDDIALVLAVPLASLALGCAVLGSWADDGTLPYLRLQRLSPLGVAVSAWSAALVVAVPLATAAVAAAVALTGVGGRAVGAAAAAAAFGAAVQTSVFVAIGLRSRNAVAWGLGYVLLWEAFVSETGDVAAALSVRQGALAVADSVSGVIGTPSPVPPGAVVALAATAVLASLWTTKRALDLGRRTPPPVPGRGGHK